MIDGSEFGPPDTAWGLAAVVVLQGSWMAQQWFSQRRTTRRSKAIRSDVTDVKHHVVNDHGERNMREDIDRLLVLGEANQIGLAELRGVVMQLSHQVDASSPRIIRPTTPRQGW